MRARVLATLLGLLSACSFNPAGFPGDDRDGGTSPPDASPQPDADPCAADEIAANASHTCARRADGLVWCWGNNELGQIAAAPTGQSTANSPCNPLPAVSAPQPAIAALGLADMSSCAITPAATVWCWGSNLYGQFGDGTSGFFTSSPTEIDARAPAVKIVGGETHICHQTLSGEVFCSGGNNSGELGVGSRTSRTIPARVLGLETVTTIASGYRHMCAVRAAGGQVLCWGANGLGQVTWEQGGDALVPVAIGVNDADQVTAGLSHSCALGAAGGVSCWGSNSYGQLGDATVEFRSSPVAIALAGPIDAIAAGGNRTCAIKREEVYCWGESLDPMTGGPNPVPTVIPLPGPARRIATGAYHECALLADQTVWCWGWNAYGQKGDGMVSGTIDNTPVRVHLCGP